MNPIQVTYRGLESSPALSARIDERAARLQKLCARITRCHVTIRAPNGHHRHGDPFEVVLDVTVPERELVEHANHEDAFVAVDHAFETAERLLRDGRHLRRSER
jgi:ribosomal subunit interface protein